MLPCRVQQVDHLSHDVVRLLLKLPEGQRLQFLAGQYLDFMLADGRRRAFSIANAPHDDEFIELHIRHVDGGQFTDWVFSQMKERTILRIQAPLGTFVLDEPGVFQQPFDDVNGDATGTPLPTLTAYRKLPDKSSPSPGSPPTKLPISTPPSGPSPPTSTRFRGKPSCCSASSA